jgi:hypothetical protein
MSIVSGRRLRNRTEREGGEAECIINMTANIKMCL